MNREQMIIRINFALLAILLGYMFLTYGQLPEKIAVHFALDGTPNGWDEKDDFFLLFGGIIFLLNVLPLVAAIKLLPKIPPSMMNVPWKEYWLSSEKRKAVFFSKQRTLAVTQPVFLNVFFLFIYHLVYAGNVSSPIIPGIPVKAATVTILVMATLYIAGIFVYIFATFKPKE